jgi:2'-5' RNA ligase
LLADVPLMAATNGHRVIAIDVLLLPDATMVKNAIAANARLRENYPQGYKLGQDQTAHITLVHSYVREEDLPAIEAQVSKLAQKAHPENWELTAKGYTSAVWSGLAITTIAVERTKPLDVFQENVEKIVGHYAVKQGMAAAFSTNGELPKIEHDIIDYVRDFATKSSGENYKPHVTIGVAQEDFVEKLKAQPFEKFSFKPAGVAIYQLGNFGTAQKRLWKWSAAGAGRSPGK